MHVTQGTKYKPLITNKVIHRLFYNKSHLEIKFFFSQVLLAKEHDFSFSLVAKLLYK